jgi:hypothetical protein
MEGLSVQGSSRRSHGFSRVVESVGSVAEEVFDRTTIRVMWCRVEEDRGPGHGEEATWPTPPHGAATSSSWPLPSLQASSLLSSLP